MPSMSISMSLRGQLVSSTKFSPLSFFSSGEVGLWFDTNDITTLFQDTAGTIPVTTPGQTVALMRDKSGRGKHATQATAAQRPTYGVIPYGGLRNILVSTDALATQTVSVGAVSQTLSFTGTGSIVLSGAYTGTLVGTGVSNRVSVTFTPTAGNLTLTVTGSVTFAQLEKGTSVTNYQRSITKYNITEIGKATVGVLFTDGVDDGMVTPSIDFSGTDKVTVWAGVEKLSDATRAVVMELGPPTATGSFAINAPTGTGIASFGFSSTGTASSFANSVLFAAPIVSVLTGIGDISGDRATLQVNNSQVAQATTDQGTGNYSNSSIYLFRRGGSTLPFNGIFTSLIVRGAQSSVAQLLNGNTYINSTLGAY